MIKSFTKIAAAAVVLAGSASATPVSNIGCSDGTREGFANVATYPSIAACSAAWTIPGINLFAPIGMVAPSCPGLMTRSTNAPACNRAAGNTGTNSAGTGCNVADVCAAGWEVCTSEAQVRAASGGASCSGIGQLSGDKFFATRQSSSGCGNCALGNATAGCTAASCKVGCFQDETISNDIFGCGTLGASPTCGSLNRFSNNLCSSIASGGFQCDDPSTSADNTGICETYTFLSTNFNGGGVLCCKTETAPDTDDDGIPDGQDNCPLDPNPGQENTCHPDSPQGDACDNAPPCDDNIPADFQCSGSCAGASRSSEGTSVSITWTNVPGAGQPCNGASP